MHLLLNPSAPETFVTFICPLSCVPPSLRIFFHFRVWGQALRTLTPNTPHLGLKSIQAVHRGKSGSGTIDAQTHWAHYPLLLHVYCLVID
jgi:hypothetical protein